MHCLGFDSLEMRATRVSFSGFRRGTVAGWMDCVLAIHMTVPPWRERVTGWIEGSLFLPGFINFITLVFRFAGLFVED